MPEEDLPEIKKPPKQVRVYPPRPPARTLKNGKKSQSRKTSELPCKILTYGVPFGPSKHQAEVELEYIYGGQWQNLQVAIVHEYRKSIRVREATYPAIAEADVNVKTAQDALNQLEDVLKDQRVEDRKRTPPSSEQYAAIKAARAALSAAYQKRSKLKWDLRKNDKDHKAFMEERKVAYEHAVWVAERGPNYKGHQEFLRKYQQPYDNGIYPDIGVPFWGTRGLRLASVKQATKDTNMDRDQDPNFHASRGDGRIGIQIMGGPLKGMTVAQFLSGGDNRIGFRLDEPYGTSKRAQIMRRGVFSMRIGTQEDGSPMIAEFPVVYHRPLPPDGLIKNVWVRRQKFGYRYRYELQIVVEADFNKKPKEESEKTLGAIDIGWRVRPDGMRVMVIARTAGSPLLQWNGQVVEHPLPYMHGGLPCSEVRMPGERLGKIQPPALREKCADGKMRRVKRPENLEQGGTWPGRRRDRLSIWAALERADELRSIRDRLKNNITESLMKHLQSTPSEWLKEQTEFIDQWKSPKKLIGLCYRWVENRFDGDEDIFAALDAWRVKEKHLHQWQADMRQRGEGQREDFYQSIAKQLARTLSVIKIEAFNLSEVAVLPLVEDPEPLPQAARRHRTYAAVSTFRQSLTSACAREGTSLLGVEAQNTTLQCSRCGRVEKFDKAPLEHVCYACGQRWDQDENATQNIAVSKSSGTPDNDSAGDPDNTPASGSETQHAQEPLAASPSPRDPSDNDGSYS